ncbi:class I SAM-dependent methyltransferase [Novosphingobium album (ex Liu et al. 2023)]|uniref:Methyltransferase domain-containing protein n=1 Tax=Novosphingobium album (ex Liu et al. 2023) TaxID=3031130 RepID=A0ABT5WVI1_9SPHN|nr:class I SAM-dependent methyltransferase [Novosphingobium album (ex Liu et al. 2023)]MDE8653920.1 methyltransferase domain-containing protein [Novosphingobium album (ex Liu et al. 2023)]
MVFSRALARQLARPTGSAGRWLGKAMDIANRKPLRLAVDLIAPAPGEAILDAGCGTGAAMAEMLRRADCSMTGADISATMLEEARRKLGTRAACVLAPLEALPFADATFDAVLALNVLYFCRPDQGMLRSIHRVLKPGGRLCAYVSDRRSMEGWPLVREGYHRLYDRSELVAALVSAGFALDAVAVHDVRVTRKVGGLLALARR